MNSWRLEENDFIACQTDKKIFEKWYSKLNDPVGCRAVLHIDELKKMSNPCFELEIFLRKVMIFHMHNRK